jgi:NAD(P)-dependent dehydrogenase (short-subunit alcohol dehydrogenase family)
MIQAVLPSMRARGSGKIANVSSLAGRIPGPLLGMYAASKFAVEAMSESLRLELAATGVQVTIIEPGMFVSDWQTTNLDVCRRLRDGQSPYEPFATRGLDAFRATAATRPGSASVAAAMADIVELDQRLPLRWPVGNDSVHYIPVRNGVSDEVWQHLRDSGAFGYWRRPMYADEPGSPALSYDWSADNVVFITGASRGFGAAAARELAARGNTVVATMRNPGRDAPGVIAGFEGRIHPIALDVTDDDAVGAAVAEAVRRFGRIDVLVNNAGYGLYGPIEEFTEEEVRRQFDTNFVGQFRLVSAVLPHMRVQGHGKVVNVSSLSGQVPSKLMGFYAASKHAVEAASETLAEEVSRWNVQVTILEPGMYRSDWQTTNLEVCRAVREGRSAYQPGAERALAAFRRRAATRPGSDAVAAAIADIVQLQQPLPLRWPIGDDAISLIHARRATSDHEWEARMLPFGWGFSAEDMAAT